ncbi:hypothetical protein [Myxosarcina sp. GI1(2024)]
MFIPVPQRVNNKLSEEFYPLQKEELIALRKAKLINNAAYVHFALRAENPFCDRPVQIVPKEFALRWQIPEVSKCLQSTRQTERTKSFNYQNWKISHRLGDRLWQSRLKA